MPSKEEYWKNPEKFRKATRQYQLDHPEETRIKKREEQRKKRLEQPEHLDNLRYRRRADNPERYLLQHAKERAKLKGLDFDLDIQDILIPTHCPVIGLELKWGVGQRASANRQSPSLDRLAV